MEEQARNKLCELVTLYGEEFYRDSKRCKSFLRDYCPQYEREVFGLVTAMEQGIVTDLLQSSASNIPQEIRLSQLKNRLQKLGLSPELAIWSINSWAFALGIKASLPEVITKESDLIWDSLPPISKLDTTGNNIKEPDLIWDSSPPVSDVWNPPPPVPTPYRVENVFVDEKVINPSPIIPPSIRYAGFWLRFVASMIDTIILAVLLFILAVVFQIFITIIKGGNTTAEDENTLAGFILIAWIIIPWLYSAFMESSPKQATLGKMALGIVVTDLNYNRISFGKATARHFGKVVSALILYIGFIMAGFTDKKQALHDMMASCLVLNKK